VETSIKHEYTTRPKSVADLTEWDLRGRTIATIDSQHLVKFPSLGLHLLAALAEAERLGLTVKDGEIVDPLTDEEIGAKVIAKQKSWDYDRAAYEKARGGEPVESWRRYQVDNFAAAEGLAPIDWPEVSA